VVKQAIIYLHGFNSASVDLSGNLLKTKQKLLVLDRFCQENQIKFCTPNVDYRDFKQLIAGLTELYVSLQAEGAVVLFMGSSMGGFTSEYMAMKTHSKAIMINPAISPSELLLQFVGVTANYEIDQPYHWTEQHCQQYQSYENELKKDSGDSIDRTILVDMADELIDSSLTIDKYKSIANVVSFAGGSHSFEHIEQALSTIKKVIYGGE